MPEVGLEPVWYRLRKPGPVEVAEQFRQAMIRVLRGLDDGLGHSLCLLARHKRWAIRSHRDVTETACKTKNRAGLECQVCQTTIPNGPAFNEWLFNSPDLLNRDGPADGQPPEPEGGDVFTIRGGVPLQGRR